MNELEQRRDDPRLAAAIVTSEVGWMTACRIDDHIDRAAANERAMQAESVRAAADTTLRESLAAGRDIDLAIEEAGTAVRAAARSFLRAEGFIP